MSFSIQKPIKKDIKTVHQLVFTDSVRFLNNSSGNLVKTLEENEFYHLSQEFNTNVLDLLKKKGFFSYDYWNSFEIFKEGLPSKDKSYDTFLIVKLVLKIINIFLMFRKLVFEILFFMYLHQAIGNAKVD